MFRFYIFLTVYIFIFALLSSCGGSDGAPDASGDIMPWTESKQLGEVGANTEGLAVATDDNGNIYVAGFTDGDLDGNTLTGAADFFVTKYDSSGVKQFTQQLGVAGSKTVGFSVATDANGNVYVAGHTNGGLDGNVKTGIYDFFVTKYDSNGIKQFTRQLGISDTAGLTVATDFNGNVYVAGYTTGNLDGGIKAGNTDAFITKYDSNGVKQYTNLLGETGRSTYGLSVTADANGNVYVAGYTTGNLDGNTLTGINDVFFTKYNSSGVKQYTKQLGVTVGVTRGYSIITDANGNIYVAGYTTGHLDGNTKTGNTDFFITKYDSNGAKQYTNLLGETGRDSFGRGVATDANGNVYVTGYTDGDLDGNILTGTTDFFITKYDDIGIKQYTTMLGAVGSDSFGRGVAVDANGNVYVAGYTDGDLDGNILTGTTDFFVTKYDSNGVKQ